MLILTLYFSPSYTPSSSFSIFLSISLHSQSLALPFIFNTISISPSLPLSQSVCLLAPPPTLSLISFTLSFSKPTCFLCFYLSHLYISFSFFVYFTLPSIFFHFPPSFLSFPSLSLITYFFLSLLTYVSYRFLVLSLLSYLISSLSFPSSFPPSASLMPLQNSTLITIPYVHVKYPR